MVYPTGKLPFEDLTTIDERVDYIHQQVASVQLGVNKMLGIEGGVLMGVVTRDVNLRITVQPLTGVRLNRPSPLTGKIVQIIPHWPDGCNALVDVAVGHKDTWVYPHETDTFIALNDATPVLTFDEPITKGEEIWMIVRNADGVNPHAVSCTFTIIGVE